MADQNKFEEMLERLINEDKEGAQELFHEIVVEKSRDIYESLLESDLDEIEEDEEVEESEDDEAVEEAADEEVEEDEDDLEEGFDLDEFEVEADPMDMGGDPADDMMADLEGGDDEEGDEEDEDMEDRVMDLEDALDDLKAEFEKMMAGDDEGEEEGDMDMDDEEGDEEEAEEESYAFESDDEDDEDEVDESEKTAGETMREYVEKVNATMGDNGVNNKSAVAGKNDMGGTASNLNQSKDEKGAEAGAGSKVQGSALNDQNPKEDNAGNVNVPGAKAAKAGKGEPGHGAEKKGKPESADNKKSVVGK